MMTIRLQTISSIVTVARGRPQPEDYARSVALDLRAARRGVASGRVTSRRLLRTIVTESGWSKRTPQNMRRISAALMEAGVFPDLDITDLRFPLSDWVRLSDTPFPSRSMSRMMVTEAALNRFLIHYHDTVFADMDGLGPLEFVGSEVKVRYEGEERRVDLLFRDGEGTLVAVETERGDPQQNSVFQLRGYLDALAAGGGRVRGVLISARPRSAQLEEDILEELREVEYPTAWYWYDVSIGLERLDSEASS